MSRYSTQRSARILKAIKISKEYERKVFRMRSFTHFNTYPRLLTNHLLYIPLLPVLELLNHGACMVKSLKVVLGLCLIRGGIEKVVVDKMADGQVIGKVDVSELMQNPHEIMPSLNFK